MSHVFTAEIQPGKERHTIQFSGAGTTANGLTVVIDSDIYISAAGSGAKKLLEQDLERLIDQLRSMDFPPV